MKIKCKTLVSICHPNGFSINTHSHEAHELVYCLEGRGSATIDRKKYAFFTGNYYITRKGTLHTEKDDCVTRIIYFYFDAPADLVPEGMHTDYDGSVLSTVKKLQRESEGNETHRDEMIECLIMRILIESIRNETGNKKSEGMRSVVQYVDENIEQDIDFRALAESRHYSFDRFRHVFKEFTGFSPHQYVINGRIAKAKFLLELNPNASLTEVSYACGFSSSSHFTKAFRTKVGVTPTEYAKAGRKCTD